MENPVVDFFPHPITTEGREMVVCSESGMTMEAAIDQIAHHHRVCAWLNGKKVPEEQWLEVVLDDGDLVTIRVLATGGDEGSNPIAVVLSIAVLAFAPVLAGKLAARFFTGLGPVGIGVLGGVIGTVGLLIVNALFPPRLPSFGGRAEQAPQQYSLSGGANRYRPYEPLLLLLGKHRIFPDYAAKEYTEYDSDGDQFLNQIFDFGIGELDITEEQIGDTDLASFDSVTTQKQVAITIVSGNVDSIQGGEFDLETNIISITRITAGGTIAIAFDIVCQHFIQSNSGKLEGESTPFKLRYRIVGTNIWTDHDVNVVTPDGADGRNSTRRSFKYTVPEGEYECRVRIYSGVSDFSTVVDPDNEKVTFSASVAAIRAYQAETADFGGRNPFATRIKATGQLYGRIDSFNSICYQKVAHWDGSGWTAPQRSSNPGDILYKYLRGWYDGLTLIAGMGLSDERIDLTSIQGFVTHCETHGLECNVVIEDGRDHSVSLTLICQCGWGSIDQQTGKWGVLFEDEGTAVSAIINPDNVIVGSMNVSYENEGLADELIGDFIDSASDYETNQLRRTVPDIVTPVRPTELTLEGITLGTQAAKEINRAVAAQAYHTRTISWEMEIDEAMIIARGDVVGITHGLIGQGKGGRFLEINDDRDEVVGSHPPDDDSETGYIWIWDLNDDVLKRSYTVDSSLKYILSSALPLSPVNAPNDPYSYRYMAFPNESDIDLAKVRITGREPSGQNRIRFTARDEVDHLLRSQNFGLELGSN